MYKYRQVDGAGEALSRGYVLGAVSLSGAPGHFSLYEDTIAIRIAGRFFRLSAVHFIPSNSSNSPTHRDSLTIANV
jgi:hypothetical protein